MSNLTAPTARHAKKKKKSKLEKIAKQSFEDSGNWPKANNKLKIIYSFFKTLQIVGTSSGSLLHSFQKLFRSPKPPRLPTWVGATLGQELHCWRELTWFAMVGKKSILNGAGNKNCKLRRKWMGKAPSCANLKLWSRLRGEVDQRTNQKFNRETLETRANEGQDKLFPYLCMARSLPTYTQGRHQPAPAAFCPWNLVLALTVWLWASRLNCSVFRFLGWYHGGKSTVQRKK